MDDEPLRYTWMCRCLACAQGRVVTPPSAEQLKQFADIIAARNASKPAAKKRRRRPTNL
jgi:hypothetical protein